MGVVKTESINTETSQLLRDILQGKEQKLGDHIMENNNLSGLCTKDLDNNTDLMQSRYGHSPVYQNGSFSCDDSSNNSTDVGGDGDSDIDVGDFEMNDDDHENSEDNIRSNDASSNIDDSIEEDEKRFESNEAKRARVENIITGMRSTDGSEHMMYGMDVRKPKRKQYQPQQHDAKLFEHSDSKIRRTERQDMKEQLRHLKKQIYFIQKKYEDVYEDSSKTDKGVLPSVPDEPKQNSERNDYNKENSHGQQNGKSDHFEGLKIPQFDACETEITPSYILKQASKIMKDQETTRKQSFMLSGSLDKSDVAKLAKNLKEELSGAITVAVDSVVEKFLKCQAKTKQSKEVQVPPINRTPQKHFELQETRSPHLHHDFFKSLEKMSAFSPPPLSGLELPRAHAQHAPHGLHFPPPLSYYLPSQVLPPPPIFSINAEPEQTEALPLVVNTPAKKKRTKVTDTRLSPRAARALLQESVTSCMNNNGLEHHERHIPMPPYGPLSHILPTEVAIRNPDLQHSAILGCFRDPHTNHIVTSRSENSSPFRHDIGSPGHSPTGSYQASIRSEPCQEDGFDIHGMHITSTLTPMHLRKAKLMFFYVRYPSSAILKVYFPDIKFNKNNTAQLVKWFSNFREFYYIQMEKYARQAMAEGVKHIDELVVTTDSELYRVLNLHYNRNNQLEVPENFRVVVQSTLREFFKSVAGNKDTEPSWKKAIYKVIARMDDTLPEYFKSPNWMEQLGEI